MSVGKAGRPALANEHRSINLGQGVPDMDGPADTLMERCNQFRRCRVCRYCNLRLWWRIVVSMARTSAGAAMHGVDGTLRATHHGDPVQQAHETVWQGVHRDGTGLYRRSG